ncbi:MAG TPA: hypothetical protein VHY59_03475 [Chthoniobacterales bacterium]|nr:hypothetical protein [Chthoniobacterales bacterium]
MNAKMFFAFVLSTSLFVSSAEAIVYTIRTVSGPVTYSLEVPSSTPVEASIKPDEQVGYSANFHLTAGSAEVIAVGWAGGLKAKDKIEPYPNSLTILGGEVPGGFYDATYVRPTSVQRIDGRVPYYLVQMRGNVAGTAQTLYAAVLDDGRVVRPAPANRYAQHPVGHYRANLAGSRGKKKSKPRVRAVEEAGDGREMGGAGLKKKLGLTEEKSSE